MVDDITDREQRVKFWTVLSSDVQAAVEAHLRPRDDTLRPFDCRFLFLGSPHTIAEMCVFLERKIYGEAGCSHAYILDCYEDVPADITTSFIPKGA